MTRDRHDETKHPLDCPECKRLTRGYKSKTGKEVRGIWHKAQSEHAEMNGFFDVRKEK